MSFRGINTTVIQIRRQVFTEVARMAYANVKGEQANHLMRKIPYTIIPGEEGKLRKDIFLERAIVEERVRLAMGLPTRRMDEHNSVVSGLEDASIADKYYDPPLVNVIKFACNRCPEKLVKVSDLCQGCLAHPCMEVCPKKAITWESGRSTIDQEKCIKCGRCVASAPTTPSSRPSVPAPLPAAWAPSTPMSWAAPRSTTASACPAASVWSTAPSVPSPTRARSTSSFRASTAATASTPSSLPPSSTSSRAWPPPASSRLR